MKSEGNKLKIMKVIIGDRHVTILNEKGIQIGYFDDVDYEWSDSQAVSRFIKILQDEGVDLPFEVIDEQNLQNRHSCY